MKKTLLFTAIAFCSTAAVAANTGSVTGKVSTLGPGLEYTFPVNEQFEAGANVNYFNYENTFTINEGKKDAFDIDANIRFLSVGAIGRYYPMDNGFNINGGLYYNGNRIKGDFKPKPNKVYEFNDTEYTSSEIKDPKVSITPNKVSPYIGIGWRTGDRNQEGLSFDANLGVMFQGTPTIETSVKCSGELAKPNIYSKAACDRLQKDIAKERNKIQDDLSILKFWPVASIGVTYRF